MPDAVAPPDDALVRIEARLARLEASMDRLTGLLDHANNAIPMAVDSVDEALRRYDDVDARLESLTRAVERLTEPATLDALSHLASHAPRLRTLGDLAASFDDTTAMAFDIADEYAADLAASGASVDERVRGVVQLVERVSEPATLKALHALVDHAPLANSLAEYAHLAPGWAAMAADTFDEIERELQADGFDLEEAALSFFGLLKQFNAAAPGIQRLLDSRLLEPGTIDGLVALSSAMATAMERPPKPVGLFGVLGATSDPKVQRAAGLLVSAARNLGDNLESLPSKE